MSYINDNLSKNEQVIAEVKLSKLSLILPSILLVPSLILWVMLPIPLYMFLKYYTTEQAITNKKVIKRTGIISRNIDEMRLDKAETVEFKQSVLGRLLNYGDVIVTGTGTSKVVLKFVTDPRQLKNYIDNLLD
jgi:uncharacterized membrane protein YdbT with pleckstrin-like domain